MQTTLAILQLIMLMQSIHSRSLMPTSGCTGLIFPERRFPERPPSLQKAGRQLIALAQRKPSSCVQVPNRHGQLEIQ
jgi:hypothetical protein